MKKLSLILVIASLIACNSKKKADSPESGKDSTQTTQTTTDNPSDPNEKMLASLRALTPLNDDQLKAKIPATLFENEATDVSVSSSMGAGLATALYRMGDSAKVNLSIFDCAGDGGAGVYNVQYAGMINQNIDNEQDYTKTVSFEGGKAYEQCQKHSNDCNFTFFTGGRFLVSLESGNVPAEVLMKEAKKIKL